MLVISRKTEEFVQIGDNIMVKIIKCTNGSVKIGIEAPGELRVLRGELQCEPSMLPKALPSYRRSGLNELCESENAKLAEAI
ncbi:carbon storage regulator [Planctomicrobium sp. SH661]|uniref:carbon storage regulator n=1 Tax=Planctomicrobium sp. SH661 TaxID=3448124 RepID=UPI003F5CB0E9